MFALAAGTMSAPPRMMSGMLTFSEYTWRQMIQAP